MEILSNLTGIEKFSYSKLSSFHNCKYGYRMTYKEGNRGIGNSMAEVGSLAHSVLERYLKGDIKQEDMSQTFLREFEEKVGNVSMKFSSKFSRDCTDSYKNSISKFLSEYDGFPEGIVLGVETEFEILVKIANKNRILKGIIDVLVRDSDGNYIVVDYKSKGAFKNKSEIDDYAKQLYFYSMYIKEQYGVYPKQMKFIQFRIDHVEVIEFDEERMKEVMQWVEDTLKLIDEEEFYPPNNSSAFFCHNLCNHRENCMFLPEF